MVTGVLNAILVYAVAYHVQLWTTKTVARWTRLREEGAHSAWRYGDRPDNLNIEDSAPRINNNMDCPFRHYQQQQPSSCPPSPPRPAASPPSTEISCGNGCCNDGCGDRDTTCPSCLERFRKHISDVSTLCTLSGYTSDSNGPDATYVEEGQGGTGVRRGLGLGAGCGRPADALWVLENDGFSFAVDIRDRPEVSISESNGCCGLLRTLTKVLARWIRRDAILTFSILLFLLVGLPLACFRHEDLFLDIGFIFTVWLTLTSAQTRVKRHVTRQGTTRHDSVHHHDHHHHRDETNRPSKPQIHRKSLTVLAALLNPVLWTSLFLLCYGLAKSRIRNTSPATIVAQFKTGNTISDLIAHHVDVSNLSNNSSSSSSNYNITIIPFGAGDLATSILNAGIVSWGLKLFEYRAHLFSRGGLTVLLTTAAMALFNVVVWPVLVTRMGVRPAASALSFAARSVTIALGGPALESIGGDAGINAVGVVVNGICFQLVAGLVVLLVGEGCDVEEEERVQSGRGLRRRLARWWMATVRMIRGGEHQAQQHPRRSLSQPGGSSDAARTEEEHQQHQQLQDGATSASLKNHQHDGTVQTPLSSSSSSSRSSPIPALHTNNDQYQDLEAGSPPSSPTHHQPNPNEDPSPITTRAADASSSSSSSSSSTTTTAVVVANGITIGINAAAMGTSHLYEQNSPAAAYSALSMTTFGVFTVLFTVQSPLTTWLVEMVGG